MVFKTSAAWPVASITALARRVSGSTCSPPISTAVQLMTSPQTLASRSITSSTLTRLKMVSPAFMAVAVRVAVVSTLSAV